MMPASNAGPVPAQQSAWPGLMDSRRPGIGVRPPEHSCATDHSPCASNQAAFSEIDLHRGRARFRCSEIGVATHDQMIGSPADRQEAAMVCEMACTAQEHAVQCIVTATVLAMDNVMQLQPACRAATIRAAPTAVAPPDETHHTGWNVLVRSLGRIAVDRPDVLCIAVGALHGSAVDRDLCTRTFLPALLAAPAGRDDNLEFARPVGSDVGAPSRTALHSALMNASGDKLVPCSSSSTMRT